MREEVAKESGMFIPRQPMISPTYMMTDPFFGPVPRAAMNGGYPGPQRMGDIFGPPMTPGMMGGFRFNLCLFSRLLFSMELSGPWLIIEKWTLKWSWIFPLNIFQDCIQPFKLGHEILSWLRLRCINAHRISLPASYITASWYQFTLLAEQGHLGVRSLSRAISL